MMKEELLRNIGQFVASYDIDCFDLADGFAVESGRLIVFVFDEFVIIYDKFLHAKSIYQISEREFLYLSFCAYRC